MTRADIIRAAFKVWGRDYYHGASLSKVAGELGVSKAALYRHFCGKQALLEAMYEWFLDDYTAKVKDGFRQAAGAAGPGEALFILVRVIMDYYARNAHLFIFSLVYVYGERGLLDSRELLVKRGLNMEAFDRIRNYAPSPQLPQFVLATLTFGTAYFHRLGIGGGLEGDRAPAGTDEDIGRNISLVLCIISRGLGFHKKETEALDYGLLEGKVSGINQGEENELLHSVAEAVAGAGPWDVSMEMVARVSGLSKSGLYAHFTNKRDMLVRLFGAEFDRIIDFAEESMKFSAEPAERLYLALFAIGDYLRSRPDVLIALDWLRTRRIGATGPEEKKIPRFYRIFRDLQGSPELKRRFPGIEDEWIPAWVLFLIVTSMIQSVRAGTRFLEWLNLPKGRRRKLSREEFAGIPNETFRNLYRFIVSGLGDFSPPPPPRGGGGGCWLVR
jgi:AcrR family transcriptional regulator